MYHSLTPPSETRGPVSGELRPIIPVVQSASDLSRASNLLDAVVAGSMVSSVFFSLLSQGPVNRSPNKYVRLRF